jgi:putative ABC transport system ATP-binding protein
MSSVLPLSLVGVTKVYGRPPSQVRAVDNVTLHAEVGEVIVIVGPSGSGKTTLLSIAGCLLQPSAGRVEVMGHDITALRERELPRIRIRHIGFVFQSFNLLDPLSAEENVRIALNLAGVRGGEALERATDLLDQLGLRHTRHRRPSQLSAGERQRVAIARALANRPSVVLADEPTANLDSRSGLRVMELLSSAVRRGEGQALVVVTHDQRLLDVADRVLWMEDGRLKIPSDSAAVLPGGDAAPDWLQ